MSAYSILLSFLTISLLCITSCQQPAPIIEETTSLSINYRATFADEPLVMGQWYAYNDSINIQLLTFDFYVSDVTLMQELSPSGDGAEIKEIALLEFSDMATPPVAMAGIDSRIENVPTDMYRGVRLGIGVPSDLNRTRPIEYAPDHPLRRDDRYQSEWESYVFAVIAGKFDSDKDGLPDGKFEYRVGTDEHYQKVALLQDVMVDIDQMATLNFRVAVERLLMELDQPIDIVSQSTDENLVLGAQISENFVRALTLE